MIRSPLGKTATATVTVTSWDETRYDAPDGQPPLAQAVTISYAFDDPAVH